MRTLARRALLLVGLLLAGRPLPVAETAPEALVVANYADGERVRHPVVLLRGTAPDDVRDVVLTNESSRRDTRALRGIAHEGRFLALAELVPGENRLLVRAGAHERALRLVFVPPTNAHVVRCVYLTDSTGDLAYQTQEPGAAQDPLGRLDTAMKLLQCFTAERLYDLGFGRSTFHLELDATGRVPVHVLKGDRPAAAEYALDDQSWWRSVDALVRRELPATGVKNVVVAAYTRFDPATGKVSGHTALGGGDLGLFGSAGMFAWPRRLDDVFATFADRTPVDGRRVHDDSAGRSTVWGLASTTLGAVLHELGHAFGLPHSTAPLDVMTRGFDRFNRVFSLVEPPGRGGTSPTPFTLDEAAAFAPVSAAALKASPWFQPDAPPRAGAAPTVTFADAGATIRSKAGIRYVSLMRKGNAEAFRAFWDPVQPPPAEVLLTAGELAPPHVRFDAVRVVDAAGATREERIAFPGRFVTTWRLSKLTKPWPDPTRFVALASGELERIAADAAGRAPSDSPGAFVDFVPRFGPGPGVAAYALRTLVLDAPVKVRLLTGSDDALRVFLDGTPVVEKLVLRAPVPDEESVDLALVAGRHQLLVEVSQGGGGWGLYLRFEAMDGTALRLTPQGELVPAR